MTDRETERQTDGITCRIVTESNQTKKSRCKIGRFPQTMRSFATTLLVISVNLH